MPVGIINPLGLNNRGAYALRPKTLERTINMKNNMSIAERNRIVENHLWCVDKVIRDNRSLMMAAHLDYDDVYQQLALRLIHCVAGYDPKKGKLKQHIFAQLKFELLNCKSPYRQYGMTGAPAGLRGEKIISLDAVRRDSDLDWELSAA